MAALAARNAAKELSFSIEDTLLDNMYYLKGSSKRNRQFSIIQEVCGLDEKALLAYCPTHWLCLDQCITRILENYPALLVFFGNKDVKSAKRSSSSVPNEPTKKARVGAPVADVEKVNYQHYCIY